MQPRTTAPREDLTADEVEALLTGDTLSMSAGLEIVDAQGVVLQDISDRLVGGEIAHNNYARIHSSCNLTIEEGLDWASSRVRVYVILNSQVIEARFDLGVYLLSTPARRKGAVPETYDVEGYGLLTILDTPTGQVYRVPAGANIVDEVRTILDAHGAGTPHYLEPHDGTLSSDRIFPLDDETTWLGVVNDLLGKIGYRGLWEDWTGRFRSEPYRAPKNRATEWTYDNDVRTTILHEDREVESDYFDTPNNWVFIREDPASGEVSEPGTTDVYEVTNQNDGPTSISGRGGIQRNAVHHLDVASAEALQARGDEIVDRDKRLDATYTLTTDPNPLHWHFDIVRLDDFGGPKTVAHEWTLDLAAQEMEVVLRKV